jgi:iron-sulfur cluster assembly accessory protein
MSCCSNPHKKAKEEVQESHDHSNSSCCSAPPKKLEKIHRQMTIEEILSMFPYKAQKLSQEITNAGLHCVGCQAATWETLEMGMMGHGKTNEQIDQLVQRLNTLLEEPIDFNTISITQRGAAKLLEFASEENKQGWGIRFSEEAAGCSGFEYTLDFSEKAEKDDQVFISNGIEVHIKKGMVPRLVGCEIDYVDGLRGSGFKISNPNVRSACGCGSSHGY